jgi:hypothetical protein
MKEVLLQFVKKDLSVDPKEPTKVSIIYCKNLSGFLINFHNFLENNEDNSFLRERIAELTRQLDKSNEELRTLQVEIGQLFAYNEILKKENEELQGSRSRRRNREDDGNKMATKRKRTSSRVAAHSSEDEEDEVRNENAKYI